MKPGPNSSYYVLRMLLPSLFLGAVLASLQPGIWLIGWLSFSLLLFFAFCFLLLAARWATELQTSTANRQPPTDNLKNAALSFKGSPARINLALLIGIAFALRLLVGTALYLALPVDGYDDPDDRAGYVFTDAHRRDEQAWELASSDQSILSAFDRSFHTDQYGGLLAFCALIYRYLSPDAHRPLLLVLLSALFAALGLPFLWRSAALLWGEKTALISCLIFAIYPESILLGGAAMREPYLMTFSALALWGFVSWKASAHFQPSTSNRSSSTDHRQPSTVNRQQPTLNLQPSTSNRLPFTWLAIGITGMLLVSPAVALVTLVIFAGWLYLTSERGRISWWIVAAAVILFTAGLFLLSSSLNRQGNFDSSSPFGVLGGFLREAVKWDVYQLERGSGWVQKLFDEMPAWLRLPFVTVYGTLQPVLPAAVVEPTTLTWKIVAVLRAAGWYALLPVLVLALLTRAGAGAESNRKVILWLAVVCWAWILLTSLRGGGDQWDNPRYRAILFLWQALVAGYALVRLQPSDQLDQSDRPDQSHQRSILWFWQILICEAIFLLVFTQWYASRYFHWGSQLPFAGMVALILTLWAVVLLGGRLWAGRRTT